MDYALGLESLRTPHLRASWGSHSTGADVIHLMRCQIFQEGNKARKAVGSCSGEGAPRVGDLTRKVASQDREEVGSLRATH